MIDIDKLPEGTREKTSENIEKYGEWHTSHMIHSAPLKRILLDLSENHTDFCWYYATQHIIDHYAVEDPSSVHFTIVRAILDSEKTDVSSDKKTVDMLARELVTKCCEFKEKAITTSIINGILPLKDDTALFQPAYNEYPSIRYETDNINSLDKIFIDFISKIGTEGKKQATELTENSRERYKNYKESNYSKNRRAFSWSLWIDKEKSILSPYLSILSHVLWVDIIQPTWKREKRLKTPAFPKTIWNESTQKLFSKGNKVTTTKKEIEYRDSKGELIACADMATIDKELLPFILAGLEKMPAVTAQLTFRFLVNQGWNNVVNRISDPRVVHTKGGFSGIADLVGCKKKSDAQDIKKILHAFDSCEITLPRGVEETITGRMLTLETIRKNRNGHPSEINIILGTMMLPHAVFQLGRHNRLLLPIPAKLPPMIGDRRTHASQGLLELNLMSYLSDNSIDLYRNGLVYMPSTIWEELARRSGLPTSMIKSLKDRWTQEDGILICDGDYCTLNDKIHKNELDSLLEQGKRRDINSKRGTKEKGKKNK